VARALGVKSLPGGGYGVGPAAGAGLIDPQTGSLKALSDLTATKLPAIQSQLDQFAQTLVTEVNAIHRLGYTLTGATGTDFFDPAGVTAATIALAPGVAASGDAIAAGASAAPGDGTIALQLAGLGGVSIAALGGKTLRDFYTILAGSVGSDVQNAAQDAATQQALAEQADAQRSSVNGVSIDEEMVALITQQQAYGAAARLIKVADEMIQDLLRLI
jgi:flagellar hook-associated protein 1 FlgK